MLYNSITANVSKKNQIIKFQGKLYFNNKCKSYKLSVWNAYLKVIINLIFDKKAWTNSVLRQLFKHKMSSCKKSKYCCSSLCYPFWKLENKKELMYRVDKLIEFHKLFFSQVNCIKKNFKSFLCNLKTYLNLTKYNFIIYLFFI